MKMAALSLSTMIVFTALPLLCFFGAKRTKKSEIFLCILFAKSKKRKKNESPLILVLVLVLVLILIFVLTILTLHTHYTNTIIL